MNVLGEELPNDPDELQNCVDQTTAALTQKLETLETEVRETVQAAKESVEESIGEVRKIFDIRSHVRKHPFMLLGASVTAGYIIGQRLGDNGEARKSQERLRQMARPTTSEAKATTEFKPQVRSNFSAQPLAHDKPVTSQKFHRELEDLKALGVSVVFDVLRQLVRNSVSGLTTALTNKVHSHNGHSHNESFHTEPSYNENSAESVRPVPSQRTRGVEQWSRV